MEDRAIYISKFMFDTHLVLWQQYLLAILCCTKDNKIPRNKAHVIVPHVSEEVFNKGVQQLIDIGYINIVTLNKQEFIIPEFDVSLFPDINMSVTKKMSAAKEIFDYWNSKKITIHKHATYLSVKSILEKAIKQYGIEEIKESIDNYAEIIRHPKTWFTYKYTIKAFFTRDNGIECWLSINKPHEKFLTKRTKNENEGIKAESNKYAEVKIHKI